ncbi:MAG: peptidylprolyl isomerase [Bacteroidales bacterium]|nr:peptidylprolyl isomerase [Bacteroidales bacterium]
MKTLPEEPVFDIVTNMGTIKVKLYSKTPKHRDNFEKLALSGYYDGLLFHRVIDGFMIQGGDPNTRDKSPEGIAKYGQGGPGYTVPAEFIPEYRHKKGALAAARRGDAANPMKESSGSQFYLVQDENACAQLDGAYTVYGETIEGLDVIDRIAKVATDGRDRPVSDVVIKKIMLDK